MRLPPLPPIGSLTSLSLPPHHRTRSTAPPAATAITPGVVPEGYTTIQEGSARILQRGNEVFYNPVQVRRDAARRKKRKTKGGGDERGQRGPGRASDSGVV